MNWLAHVLLSEPTAQFRLGNLLADLVRGADRKAMSTDFLRGAACHKAIDAFTDSHPLVLRSRARIDTRFRRFSGVLMDIFYDYLLAQSWDEHWPQSLDTFTASFYADVRAQQSAQQLELPPDAKATLDRILKHDLLGQYRHMAGVEHSLRRVSTYISQRWGRNYALEAGAAELRAHEADLASDFAAFFPQLRAHIEAMRF
jgi:acyl carrier protein phosphodiesterase